MPHKPRSKKVSSKVEIGNKEKKPTEDIYDLDADKMLNLDEESEEKIPVETEQDQHEVDEEIDEDTDNESVDDELEIDDEDVDLEDHDKADESDEDGENGRDECLYEGSDEEIGDDDDEDVIDELIDYVASEKRRTKQILYRYEYVRCLCDRVEQLIQKAKPMIKDAEHLTPIQIAKLEIKYGTLPFFIIRTLPNGRREKWKVDELSRDHLDIDV